MNPLLSLLPDVPDDLTGLSADELSALLDSARDVADRLTSQDAETIGEASAAQVIEAATAAVEIIGRLTSEAERRETEAAEAEEALAALRAQALGADEDAEDEEESEDTESSTDEATDESTDEETDDEDEDETAAAEGGEAESTAEPVAASARQRRRMPRSTTRTVQTAPGEAMRVPVVASVSAEGVGRAIGERITTMRDLREIIRQKGDAMRGTYAEGDREQKVPLVRFRTEYPEDRQLFRDTHQQNTERVERIAGVEAVTAAGICAPVTPVYDLAMESVADRPVAASLPTFQATRGGILFGAPPKLSDVSTAVGRVTNAQAIAGGTPAVKGCQVVPCPTFSEVDVAAIYQCLKSDNLNARAFPERLDQFTQLVAAAHARLGEASILDAMVTGSTAVTAGQAIGAVGDLVKHVLTAAAGQRSRHRMRAEQPLHVMFPAWTLDLLLADQVRSTFDRFRTRADIEAALRVANVNITWYMDTMSTGTSQVYGAQAASGLLDFPNVVRWFLFPEGSWLYLDSGELDLGIVRDNTLNTTNEFTVFMENWENVAFLGVESLAVTSTLCDTGQTGNQIAIACAS